LLAGFIERKGSVSGFDALNAALPAVKDVSCTVLADKSCTVQAFEKKDAAGVGVRPVSAVLLEKQPLVHPHRAT
jgi:hypothetical protein